MTDHEQLRRLCAAEGLDFLGVARVPDAGTGPEADEARRRYREWVAEGRHGTMAFLERHEAAKYDPDLSLEGARSVVVAGLGYYQERPAAPAGSGLVARYAWGRDYHKVLLAKLKRVEAALGAEVPGARWRCFTDTAPLDERWWAQRAGASFTARNTLAVNRKLGSWFLLGEILTTAVLEPTAAGTHAHGGCPSACRRCSSVCPTGALDPAGRIDARLCIAYLTIEHRGPWADELKPLVGSWLFGCDLCQEVCPLNLGAKTTTEAEFQAWKAGPDVDLAEVLDLTPGTFTARFGGSPVHRAGRDGLVRNACVVAANRGLGALVPRLRELAADPDPGVADAAAWAVGQLEARP